MKITEHTIKFLSKTLCCDNGILPYKKGRELVDFFVEFGADDVYGEGFPSRWQYTEDKVREFNNTTTLKSIIENSVEPRDLMGSENEVLRNAQRFIHKPLEAIKAFLGIFEPYRKVSWVISKEHILFSTNI